MDILNIDKIMAAVDLAWAEEMEVVDASLNQSFELDKYPWRNGNQTRRQNGEIVTSPRNIVDTGRLQSSQYKATIAPGETEFGWTEDDPELNHNGGMTSYNGHQYYHTPRPWTQYAIAGDGSAPIEYQKTDALVNVPEDFATRLNRHLETLQDD